MFTCIYKVFFTDTLYSFILCTLKFSHKATFLKDVICVAVLKFCFGEKYLCSQWSFA